MSQFIDHLYSEKLNVYTNAYDDVVIAILDRDGDLILNDEEVVELIAALQRARG